MNSTPDPGPPASATPDAAKPLPPGRIDIHSHLLPGVDDGCQNLDESLTCVRRLIERGFVATICTPHMWAHLPANTPDHVTALTLQLQAHINAAGLEYRVYPGGELGLRDGVIDWMKEYGVPTLADSRCVLADFWDDNWPDTVDDALQWLLDQNYQPILAHPERIPCHEQLDQRLRDLASRGVWLQGNTRCYTGEEGYLPDLFMRQFLSEGRYRLLALDMHGPDSLPGRFDGMDLIARDMGPQLVQKLMDSVPRQDVLGLS